MVSVKLIVILSEAEGKDLLPMGEPAMRSFAALRTT